MVPFGHETSYVMIQAPMADGGYQDKALVGGATITMAAVTGPSGQAVQHK